MPQERPDSITLLIDHRAGQHQLPEAFWLYLPVLGPTSTLLLQHVTGLLMAEPQVDLPITETAKLLGLGESPWKLWSSIKRLDQFHMIQRVADDLYTVRLELPALTPGQQLRVPEHILTEWGYARVAA